MQDLMKQIIDMDQKAREITDSAQKEKIDSEKEVSQRREEIRKKYLDEARQRLAKDEPSERAAAEAAWKEKDRQNEQIMNRLNTQYAEKGDEWVSEIVQRVIGGIS